MPKSKSNEQFFRERVEMIKEIALTYGRTKGATELAKKYKVSKQYVGQIAERLRKRGVVIPKMKLHGALNQAVKELKKENKGDKTI